MQYKEVICICVDVVYRCLSLVSELTDVYQSLHMSIAAYRCISDLTDVYQSLQMSITAYRCLSQLTDVYHSLEMSSSLELSYRNSPVKWKFQSHYCNISILMVLP